MILKNKCVLIDNYDSFTYNLVHLLKELGAEVTVLHNDQFTLDEIEEYDKIILSPGPGLPSDAGLLLDVIRYYAGKKLILGVCLGHQLLLKCLVDSWKTFLMFFMVLLPKGYNSFRHPCLQVYPDSFPVGRYHSWVVSKESFPSCLEIIVENRDGLIMALRHRTYNIYGIQFHPESILTPDGKKILSNWLEL